MSASGPKRTCQPLGSMSAFRGWSAMGAPKGTSPAIIARLNSTVVDALADPSVQRRLADLGQEVPAQDQRTPAALAAFQVAEIERWWPIIKDAGIKAE